MLSIDDFFVACVGSWTIERTYHYIPESTIERSHTEYQVTPLTSSEKAQVLNLGAGPNLELIPSGMDGLSGFAVAFDTRSQTGETLSMNLRALFVPDTIVQSSQLRKPSCLPLAAQVSLANDDVIQGFYLRDEGYSEQGAIAGRFTYQATRQILEMTTYYRRSVAVDQMRLVTPETRLRTIVTYRRPEDDTMPTDMTLIGFGVEQKHG